MCSNSQKAEPVDGIVYRERGFQQPWFLVVPPDSESWLPTYITTSGNFRTRALTDVILEVGADRVLYSVDYPFENMVEAGDCFDHAAISEPDRLKIALSNAWQLFHF